MPDDPGPTGPDAYRYWCAARGVWVPRPFHLRWLLPRVCGVHLMRWWSVWLLAWPALAGATFWWQHNAGVSPWRALTVAVLLLGLPGILGPGVVIPVGVDLPATALAVLSAAMAVNGGWWLAGSVAVSLLAASIKETGPVVACLAGWSLWPLVGLVAVVVRAVYIRRTRGPVSDPCGPRFDEIAAHPFRSALAAHRGRWRDARLMVAPWGVCLVALYRPGWPVVIALLVAYGQLLVATDTVRLYSHLAGPVMAAAAVHNLPTEWLLVAAVAHIAWWRVPERI